MVIQFSIIFHSHHFHLMYRSSCLLTILPKLKNNMFSHIDYPLSVIFISRITMSTIEQVLLHWKLEKKVLQLQRPMKNTNFPLRLVIEKEKSTNNDGSFSSTHHHSFSSVTISSIRIIIDEGTFSRLVLWQLYVHM